MLVDSTNTNRNNDTNASSTDEIQMDTNGDGVVDAQDEVAQTPTETTDTTNASIY